MAAAAAAEEDFLPTVHEWESPDLAAFSLQAHWAPLHRGGREGRRSLIKTNKQD